MNLYWIYRPDNTGGYDTYSDAVVAAETAEDAARIHPDYERTEWPDAPEDHWETWVRSPDQVTVELIGTAKEGTKRGVICASFHAG